MYSSILLATCDLIFQWCENCTLPLHLSCQHNPVEWLVSALECCWTVAVFVNDSGWIFESKWNESKWVCLTETSQSGSWFWHRDWDGGLRPTLQALRVQSDAQSVTISASRVLGQSLFRNDNATLMAAFGDGGKWWHGWLISLSVFHAFSAHSSERRHSTDH